MNVFELTRALIDIESISGNEEAVGRYLYDYLAPLAARYGGSIELIEVEPRRFNVLAQWGERLDVTLSTHIDTVPPFIASSEDETYIHGRGACDTKGIIACMIKAAEALLEAGGGDQRQQTSLSRISRQFHRRAPLLCPRRCIHLTRIFRRWRFQCCLTPGFRVPSRHGSTFLARR
jgi:acetylornithine deacetylase/succinyl-diaminopimelate desuccinylase-like protein